jgi:putative hemolysin
MPDKPNIRLGAEQFLQVDTTKMPSWLKVCCIPLARLIDRFLTWSAYNRFVDRLDLNMDFPAFIRECMQEYDLSIVDVDALKDKIPTEGPVIFVSNHPTGFLETVMLPHLIMQVRPELKILANEMLAQVHWIAPQIIPLNVFKTSGVRGVMQAAQQCLADGGALMIYPSGEVADYKKDHGRITDGEWSRLPLILAEQTDAKIIHLNLAAKTSGWFRAISRVCRPIRVMWLMKELYRQGGKAVPCYSSSVTSLKRLPSMPKAKLTRFLHAMNDCLPVAEPYRQAVQAVESEAQALEPLAEQPDLSVVQQELAALPDDAVIYSYKSTIVYVVKGKKIPQTLRWIQVERERVFHEVGMGTGRSFDGDQHDEACIQVIAWDSSKQAMIASTRCDIFCQERTNTYLADLYRIDAQKLLEMGDMMEISRTFILQDYQRSFSSLLSLWRGVTRLVLRHRRVRFVSGVVSIAGDRMNEALFDCLATYVGIQSKQHAELADLFSPHYPYVIKKPVPAEVEHCLSLVSSVDELEHVFSELAKGSCQFPVLFRQYESLGTVPLAVSVDDEFSACIDVLQAWDTHDLRSEKLRLLFGDEGMDEMKRRAIQ